LRERIRREGDDGEMRAGARLALPNGSRCRQAVHLGHLHVHQHDIEDRVLQGGQDFHTAGHDGHPTAKALEHARGDFLVHRVVLGE